MGMAMYGGRFVLVMNPFFLRVATVQTTVVLECTVLLMVGCLSVCLFVTFFCFLSSLYL